jgi:flavin-dependent dehydrogenase
MGRSRPESVAHNSATWQINLQKHPRIIPVGDAAGSLDPASGLGLASALATAISAADVVQGLSRSADALAMEAASYHNRRIALILRQADELSRRYAETGILQADPAEPTVAV